MLQRILICFLLLSGIIANQPMAWAEDATLPESDWAGIATYQIEAHEPDAAFHQTEYKSYPGPIDGLSSKSEAWTGFFRQAGRNILVDLGGQRAVNRIALEFNQNLQQGILLPKYVDFEVSNDGRAWSKLGRTHHQVSSTDAQVQNRTISLSFAPLSTRYIRISFPVDVWVFARHLSISGPEGNAGVKPAILAHGESSQDLSQPFLQVPGINDILLVYTGAHEDKGTWTTNDFIPMITYADKGSYQGKMFDTMLFLPFPEVGSTKADWNGYMEDLFKEGVQLHALNEAVSRVNAQLSEQRKEKVILTLPYPDPKQVNFGSLGDKESLSFSSLEAGSNLQALQNRIQAVHWYYDNLMKKWDDAGFAHLELAGIYWYKETLDPTIPEETALVKNIAGTIHEHQQKLFWIPYYGAKGYERWQDLGFDYVLVQPNFYANQDPPEERMNNVVNTAKKYHLGLEIELDQKVLSSQYYYNLFYKQLDRGHQLALDRSVTNAYYAGAKTILYASQSKVPEARKLYDDLYRWINGSYGEDQ